MTDTKTAVAEDAFTTQPEPTVIKKKGMSTGVKVLIGCGVLTLLIVICVVVTSLLGLAGVSKVATEIDNSIKETEVNDQKEMENPSKMNETVVVGEVQWQLVAAEDKGDVIKTDYSYGDDCVANSGKFIKITVKDKNNSNDMVSVMDLDLYDSENNEYTTSSDVYSCVDDSLFLLSNINPGIEKTFDAYYEVPKTASGFKVKVGDLDFFSGSYKYISLGF